MAAARKMEVWPTNSTGNFAHWDFSSQAWSGAEYGEDSSSVVSFIMDGPDVLYRTTMFTSAEKREVWDAADAQKAEVHDM